MMLSNVSTPLVGVVDTAVGGRLPDALSRTAERYP